MKEALRISGLTEDEMEHIRRTILKLDRRIASEVSQRELIHVDGKKEFAFDKDRMLLLIDTFGTSDEDRWWDAEAFANGNIVELSKEFVRQHYRKTGYFDALEQARTGSRPEPEIPSLPEDMVRRTSELYRHVRKDNRGIIRVDRKVTHFESTSYWKFRADWI